jgi:hypothetical protein
MTEMTAVLLTMQENARALGQLDTREAGHWSQAAERLKAISEHLTGIDGTLADVGAVLGTVAEVERDLADLRQMIEGRPEDSEGPEYVPSPAPLLHEMTDEDLSRLVRRLNGWVSTVYIPGYGHLAAQLAPCWPSHALCIHGLDWLSELWSVLYMQPDRSAGVLSAMAEFQTRILPAIASQMATEQKECAHSGKHVSRAALASVPRAIGRTS